MNLFQFYCCSVLVVLAESIRTENRNYFETFYNSPIDPVQRNALKMKDYKWPNGVVYYEFGDEYGK